MKIENTNLSQKNTSNKQEQLFSFVLPVNGQATNGAITNLLNYLNRVVSSVRKEFQLFKANPKAKLVLITTFLLLFSAAVLMFYLQPHFEAFNANRLATSFGKIFLGITILGILFKLSFFFYSVYLYFKYKSIPSVSDELLPTCTVIVPAYNEGELVWTYVKESKPIDDYPAT